MLKYCLAVFTLVIMSCNTVTVKVFTACLHIRRLPWVTTSFLCQGGRTRDVRLRMLCPQTFKIAPSFRCGCQEREGGTGRKRKRRRRRPSLRLHAYSPLPQSHLWDSFKIASLRTSSEPRGTHGMRRGWRIPSPAQCPSTRRRWTTL